MKYKDMGLGTTHNQQPICVKYPPKIDQILRSIPNRSEFLREAAIEYLKQKGYLTTEDLNTD